VVGIDVLRPGAERQGSPGEHPDRLAVAEQAHAASERRRLVRLCTRLTGDVAAAEDLAQETLLRAHRATASQRESGRRQAWLDGIARHVCLD
jgi:RNA polymerase sigma-70 factor (ECF subfamily)